MSKSLISRDMQREVTKVLKEATEPNEERSWPTVAAKVVVAQIADTFGIPEAAHDDFRILLTQAVKLGCFPGFEGVRGRFGGIRRIREVVEVPEEIVLDAVSA